MKKYIRFLPVFTLAAAILTSSAFAQPTLSIAPAGNQTVLFWPAWSANYILQSTTNPVSPKKMK